MYKYSNYVILLTGDENENEDIPISNVLLYEQVIMSSVNVRLGTCHSVITK